MEKTVCGRKSKISDACAIIAQRIESIRPEGIVLLNTLKDLYKQGYNEGYHQYLRECAKLRRKRERTRQSDWSEQKTHIDDMIHGFKANLNETK